MSAFPAMKLLPKDETEKNVPLVPAQWFTHPFVQQTHAEPPLGARPALGARGSWSASQVQSLSLGVGLHPRGPNHHGGRRWGKTMQRETITCHQIFDPLLLSPGGAEAPKRPEREDRGEGGSHSGSGPGPGRMGRGWERTEARGSGPAKSRPRSDRCSLHPSIRTARHRPLPGLGQSEPLCLSFPVCKSQREDSVR